MNPEQCRGVETITCLFCGSDGHPYLEEDGWTARWCPHCRLVFLSPRPSADEVEAIYREDHAHLPADLHLQRHVGSVRHRDAAHVVSLIRQNVSGGRFIEIGPGGGLVLDAARLAGFDVAGIELNPIQAAHIRGELGIECSETMADLQSLAGDRGADVIYHRDVLSHFSDPIAMYGAFHDALNPDGILVFETGNGEFDRRYATLFGTFQFPDHLYFFTERSLDLLLAESGFERVETRRYGLIPELWFNVQLRKLRGLRKVAGNSEASATRTVPPASRVAPTGVGSLARSALEWWNYVLRYGVGRVTPYRYKPYTMIVFARRNGS